MSWVKLDDKFFRNPKVLNAGKDARDLYIAGLIHCATRETNGFIDHHYIWSIGKDAKVGRVDEARITLVEHGLWRVVGLGWEIADYLGCGFCPSPTNQDGRKTREYRAWRNTVVCRDGHQCTECGATEDLHAHHLKEWAKFPSLRYEVSNGVTLCSQCHYDAHTKDGE